MTEDGGCRGPEISLVALMATYHRRRREDVQFWVADQFLERSQRSTYILA